MCCPLYSFLEEHDLTKRINHTKGEVFKEYFNKIKGIRLGAWARVVIKTKDNTDTYCMLWKNKQVYYQAVKGASSHIDTQPFKIKDYATQHDNILYDLTYDDLRFFIKENGKRKYIEMAVNND